MQWDTGSFTFSTGGPSTSAIHRRRLKFPVKCGQFAWKFISFSIDGELLGKYLIQFIRSDWTVVERKVEFSDKAMWYDCRGKYILPKCASTFERQSFRFPSFIYLIGKYFVDFLIIYMRSNIFGIWWTGTCTLQNFFLSFRATCLNKYRI